ncbi:MAG: hypothetical protein BM564_13245 [Bacteroidetes bacterium MedPE-SWsnd-G2]|nr:MAG: hypothetical protein BM564_13245 [Bacteroidetes bacterium MedPE-SWsnd-G2]
MIEQETDSVFQLSNTLVTYNNLTDIDFQYQILSNTFDSKSYKFTRKDSIIVDKTLKLDNVQFADKNRSELAGLYLISFKKPVFLNNTILVDFINCTFHRQLNYTSNNNLISSKSFLKGDHNSMSKFDQCVFKKGLICHSALNPSDLKERNLQISFSNSIIYPEAKNPFNRHSQITTSNIIQLAIEKCDFKGPGIVSILALENLVFWMRDNTLDAQILSLKAHPNSISQFYEVSNNNFEETVFADIIFSHDNLSFEWEQIKSNIINTFSYSFEFSSNVKTKNTEDYWQQYYSPKHINKYITNYRIKAPRAYKDETKMLGMLYNRYKTNHNTESANQVYIAIKDLETQRLAYLYDIEPTFKTYFTWKVNQFLKLFSAYGTEPAQAIIVSMYVIFFFALIYLFFPNSWEANGKNRILNRYQFFLKYMNKRAGIHEVYLEDQKENLKDYENYKHLVESTEGKVPKFFSKTALPLYKWSISKTLISSNFLEQFDIMQGTWEELPKKKRFWKSALLISAFLTTVIYDLFIKIINAIMLSINTFTTLGFGEIPIKGFPRYLAILQGFIGWFMLTIFSVSLISQLLN